MSTNEPVFRFGDLDDDRSPFVFFPVGNGDMTLVETEEGHRILIDVNIRSAADDPDDDTPDVVAKLRKKLVRDAVGRLCLDALLISHPDQDHCRGLRKHFHLGPPDTWSKSDDKILVREIWSSPMVFPPCLTAACPLRTTLKAFNAEARRRVRVFRDTPRKVGDGDRILLLGEDENGKTDDLKQILVRVDHQFSQINGKRDDSMTALLLAPLPTDTDDDEDVLSKNNSSTILRFLPGRQQDRRQVPVSHRRGCRGRDLGKALESPSPPCGMVVLRHSAVAAPLLLAQPLLR